MKSPDLASFLNGLLLADQVTKESTNMSKVHGRDGISVFDNGRSRLADPRSAPRLGKCVLDYSWRNSPDVQRGTRTHDKSPVHDAMTDLNSRPSTASKVVIAGQGYVGLPIAIRAVEVGYDVVGYEPDTDRTKRLLSGSSYVEDVPDDALEAALASGRYVPSDAVETCEGFD